ncbi:CsgG/HfaB family protein [Terricaulis sp.]|uniref:CsgG/HfaB family protein n=1 Tax=Terricaulis sp. TaxID=2768686 RepID=UPI0037842797
MRRAIKALAIACAFVGMAAVEAQAQPQATASQTPQVPRCTRNLGTISIQNGDSAGWTAYRLQPPAGLLRVVIQQSGCFTVVERGAGLDAAMRERELAGGGQLQRGSNVGGGQIRAADYVLLADVVAQDNNASGGGVGAALGGVVGGRLGGVIGGMGVRSQTAQTTLALTNVRTTESLSAEGNAQNRNFTWGGVGFLGGGGAALGGYTDTEIGRVVTVAFIDAYTQLISQLGVLDTNAAAAAPQQSYRTTQATQLRARASNSGQVLRNLPAGATVYPTGERDGMWWRVQDENSNEGWVNNDFLEPLR